MEDLRKELREIRRDRRREYLKMRGIDADELDKLNEKYAKRASEVFNKLTKAMASKANEIKAKHKKTIDELKELPPVDGPPSTDMPWEIDLPGPPWPTLADSARVVFQPVRLLPFFECGDPWALEKALDQGEEIDVSSNIVLNDDNKAEGNPNHDKNECNPFIEHHSEGEINVHAWLAFNLPVKQDGWHRIAPLIAMNGYYLFQLHSAACGGGEESTGTMGVWATIKVDQLGITRCQYETPLFSKVTRDGYFGPFDYVGRLGYMAKLPHENVDATVSVGVRVKTSIAGSGNLFVDLKRIADALYFRVENVEVRRCKSLRPRSIVEAMESTKGRLQIPDE